MLASLLILMFGEKNNGENCQNQEKKRTLPSSSSGSRGAGAGLGGLLSLIPEAGTAAAGTAALPAGAVPGAGLAAVVASGTVEEGSAMICDCYG